MNQAADVLSKKINLSHIYILLALVQLFLLPAIFFVDYNPILMLIATLVLMALALTILADAIGLTFEGFKRTSRYAVSHEHPIKNKILSIMGAVSPFFILVLGPLAIIFANVLIGYSHYVSPGDPENDMDGHVYKKYWLNAILIAVNSTLLIGILVFAGV